MRLRERGVQQLQADIGADGGGGQVYTGAGAGYGEAVFDAGGGCVQYLGPGDGGDGPCGARDGEGGGRSGDRRDPADGQDDLYRGGDVPEDLGPGAGGRQCGVAAAGDEAGRCGAGAGGGQAGESITPHTKFKAEVYILTKEEGGRHTPFFNGYRPQFYFRTTDVTGVVTLPEGVEMVMPGDNVSVEVSLITPIAMEKELRFAIREGGRTVGAGVISDIIE